jgi:hypothetical protein
LWEVIKVGWVKDCFPVVTANHARQFVDVDVFLLKLFFQFLDVLFKSVDCPFIPCSLGGYLEIAPLLG